jgi:signal transduction histidine kinase
MTTRSRTLRRYVALVTVTGCSLLMWYAGSPQLRVARDARGFWLFALLLFLGEVFPISVPRHEGEVDEVTASTTFAFALMIGFGTAPAVFAQVVSSIIADLLVHKAPWKIGFNAGQYTLSLGAAGAVYHVLGGQIGQGIGSLVPFALSATVFFVLNTTITDVALGLASGVDLRAYIAKDLVFEAQATLPLLALAPVVVAAAEASLWLIPLAAAPAIAVWWGTRLALENARLAAELRGSLDHQRELNRLKDDFVAVVSHELRTPLTSIQGYVKTLLQLSPDLPDDQRRAFLEAADRQSDRLRRLIEQLLVVGRLDSHVEPLSLSWVDVDELVAHVVEELGPRAQGHAFDVRVAADLPRLRTDEGKLHQILSNLVENALKYAPPDTRLTIKADPAPEGVRVGVIDEGPGIPSDAHERIFERFYQVDQSATRRVGGTGLGLYICRRMAEALGARLWLARSDGAGSEFALSVPARAPGEAAPVGDDDQSITASV